MKMNLLVVVILLLSFFGQVHAAGENCTSDGGECGAGEFCDTASTLKCVACPDNTYAGAGTDTNCTACTSTRTTSGTGSALITDCKCPAGTYASTAANDNAGTCDDIGNGKQGQTDGTIGGTYASTGATHQVDCIKGKYEPDGNADCQPCALGTFQGSDGQTSCGDVAAGYVGRTSNDPTTDLEDSVHQTGAVYAVGCVAGSWRQASSGNSNCVVVPAGSVGRIDADADADANETLPNSYRLAALVITEMLPNQRR
jgi:hypothetical protein